MRDSVRLLPIVLLPNFVYSIFRFSTGILVPDFERAYQLTDPVAGLIVSASVGSITLGVSFSGYISARYGESRAVIMGLILFSALFGGLAFPWNLPAFTALFLVGALGGGIMTTPTYSLAASILSNRRSSAISFATAVFNVGGLIGPALVGSMLVLYGWPSPFAMLGVAGGAACALILASRPRLKVYERKMEAGGISYLSVMRNRSLVVLAVANFFADLAFVAYTAWLPKFLIASFSISGGSILLVDGIFGAGIGVGGIGVLIAGVLFDKIGGRRSALAGGLLTTVLTFILFSTDSLFSAILLVVIIGFFLNWFWALLTSMAQVNASGVASSVAISFVQTAGFIGAFLGPVLTGFLGSSSGISSSSMIVTVTLPTLIYLVALLTFYRDPPRSK